MTDLCQVVRSSRDSKNNNGDGDTGSRHVHSDAGVDTYTIWTTYAKQRIKKTCNETHPASGRMVFQCINRDLVLVKTTQAEAG